MDLVPDSIPRGADAVAAAIFLDTGHGYGGINVVKDHPDHG